MHNGDWKLIPSRGLRGVCRSVWFFCKLVSVLFHGKDFILGTFEFLFGATPQNRAFAPDL